MSKRIFQVSSFTPTQQADGVLSAGTFAGLKAGSATDILKIGKMLLQGQASSSAVTATMLARSSTLAITPTALALPNTDGPANIAAITVTTVPVPFVAAGTAPNRSPAVTIPRLNLSFNAFGGSYLNHQYLICACAPEQPDAPPEMRARLDANGKLEKKPGSPSANVGAAGLIGADWFYEVL